MNTNRKNALIITYNDLNNSGVPNVIYQTVKSLHASYNFDIIVFGDNSYYFNLLKNDGINNVSLIYFSEPKQKNIFKKFFWKISLRNKWFYQQTINLVSNKHYDVVHSFKEYDSGPFLKACKKANVGNRILHGTVIHHLRGNLLNRHLSSRNKRLSIKYATRFVGVSELCCKSTFPKEKWNVVYNGYNTNRFNNDVINKLPNDSLVLSQVGTFNENKNQLFSLNVLNELRKIYPNCMLKLIGKETGRGYLTKIKSYIRDNQLNDYVEIIDGKNGVGNNFEYTTFSILPSHQEGAGITAIESQACGIKVFASSSVTDEMDVGGLISLSLKTDPKDWAQRIFDEFKKVGNTRQHYDLSRFSQESFAKSIESIYKKE